MPLQAPTNPPISSIAELISARTDELGVPPDTVPVDSATPVVVWAGAELEVLELAVVEWELELVVGGVEVVVVEEGCQVVVGDGSKLVTAIFTLVVGGGGGGGGEGDGDGDGDGEEPPESNSHEPVRTPTEISAKNSKRPCEKSRPSSGQPGHCCRDNIWHGGRETRE